MTHSTIKLTTLLEMFFHDLAKTLHGLISSFLPREILWTSPMIAHFRRAFMSGHGKCRTNLSISASLSTTRLMPSPSLHICTSTLSLLLKQVYSILKHPIHGIKSYFAERKDARKDKSGCLHFLSVSLRTVRIASSLDFFICKMVKPE